jgi:hypothetical protein
MKIFNETKTMEIQNPDLEKGYLINDEIKTGETVAIAEVKETGHYELEKEYPNGGKDMRWVVDVPYVASKPSEPILEKIQIYIPFSAKEIELVQTTKQKRAEQEAKNQKWQQFNEQNKTDIEKLENATAYLDSTDYKAIQFAEGVLTAADFETIKQKRQEARNIVRQMQPIIESKRTQAGL